MNYYTLNCHFLFLQLLSNFSVVVCRLIQEEKQSTEARAEELESRVGSLEHMNLLVRGRSFERPSQSPPASGRSTPRSHHSPQRDYLHKYHTVSIIHCADLVLNLLCIDTVGHVWYTGICVRSYEHTLQSTVCKIPLFSPI